MSALVFLDIDGLVDHYPFLSRRVVHGLAAERRIPHRKLPASRPLLFLVAEIDEWISEQPELEVVELDRGGRIVRPRRS